MNTPSSPINTLDAFITDLNGYARGKRLAAEHTDKILNEGFKMPHSAIALDVWGDDVPNNGLVFETGDNDGICYPIIHDKTPIPWLEGQHYQLPCMMSNADGSPFQLDPRWLLHTITQQYKKQGLTPVVASELEFYLIPQSNIQQGRPTLQSGHLHQPNAYSIGQLDTLRSLLADIQEACQIQHIPADAMISELGEGQFEINLNHVANPVLAADHAVLLKRLIQGVAKKHQYHATFMAKPFGDISGNGFHIHFSLLGELNNYNVFDNDTPYGSDILQHAIAGLIDHMPDAMLIFAPTLNAYRRLTPASHAPTSANWGYENRTVAIRIPDSPNAARRIEHRVAGADANPYLVIATVLASALQGITNKSLPPPALQGDAYQISNTDTMLPTQWYTAIEQLANSKKIETLLGSQFSKVFSEIKRQEYQKLSQHITTIEYQSYF